MTNKEAYKRIENIVFKYEEKELSSLDDRKLNNEALNHIREALKVNLNTNVPKKIKGTPLEENDWGYNCVDWIP